MTISVKHVFLAMLSQKDMYGYELKSTYDKMLVIGHLLNLGQIYTTISRLERDGLVSLREGAPPDEKKVYAITDKGRVELGRWICETDVWNNYTDNLSYKLAAAEYVDTDSLLQCISEYRIILIAQLQKLTREERNASVGKRGVSLVFERNILRLEADIKWLDRCLEKLSDIKKAGALND